MPRAEPSMTAQARRELALTSTGEFPILGEPSLEHESPVTPDEHPGVTGAGFSSPSKRKLSPPSHSFSHSHSQPDVRQSQSYSPPLSRGSQSSGPPASLTERLTMMNIPTQELSGAVFYGWLWKKGQSFKTWKKRFFLLNGRSLTYYTQCCVIASDLLGGGTQVLDLPVRGGLRVARAELSDTTPFGLKVTSSSGRVLYIQAGDADARLQWLKVLQEAPQTRGDSMESSLGRSTMASDLSQRGRTSPYSPSQSGSAFAQTAMSIMSSEDDDEAESGDMQGWLHVRGALLPTWKKRYVVLADGLLSIQKSRRRGAEPLNKDAGVEVLGAAANNVRKHGLCIRLANHKELMVHAETEADASLWLKALKNCL